MNNKNCIICEKNLSVAWVKAFLKIMQLDGKEISPLIVTVTGFNDSVPVEDYRTRNLLDITLETMNTELTCNRVANTIFPFSLWNKEKNRQFLINRYHRIFRRLKKYKKNHYGLYFERIIAFQPKNSPNKPIDQIDHIIKLWQNGIEKGRSPRRSALQVSIFDPTKDHTKQPMRGFPCLQQIAFAPQGDHGLIITGFYAMQYIFERAYGNYLGLCRLGQFVAHELGLQLTQMNCIAGIANLGGQSKKALQPLKKSLMKMYSILN